MRINTLALGCFIAALAVIAGAFGAHTLKEVLNPAQLESYRTAVRYQMWHALLLILLSTISPKGKTQNTVALLAVLGIVCFSGSIYLLTVGPVLSGTSWSFLGPVTPLGGLLLISAWLVLGFTALKKRT